MKRIAFFDETFKRFLTTSDVTSCINGDFRQFNIPKANGYDILQLIQNDADAFVYARDLFVNMLQHFGNTREISESQRKDIMLAAVELGSFTFDELKELEANYE